MKKLFAILALSLSGLLCLTACGAKMPYDLSGTASVELHAYNNDSTEPFARIVVDGEEVATIVEMFSSLKLKELEYTEPSINGYDFWFKDADGNQIAKLSLPYGPSPWVVVGGTAYQDMNGGVDLAFLAQLVDAAVVDSPQQGELSDVAMPTLGIMTLQDLVQREGENLTWEDFSSYYSEDIESGMYILRYPIAEADCYLLIGGGSMELPPMYIRLVSEADQERYIDVRYESIDDFLSSIGYGVTVDSGLITKVVPSSVPAEPSNGFDIPVPDKWVNRDSDIHRSTPDTDVDPDFSIPHNEESGETIVSVPIPDSNSSGEDRQTIVPIIPEDG